MHKCSPQILHIATHGFYYTPKNAENVEFLKGQGCDATLEELVSYVKAKEGPKAELSDEELSEVSGGRNKKCVTIFGKKLCI